MQWIKQWLAVCVWVLVGMATAHADERDLFLEHQYRTQCLAFAQDPDGFRQALVQSDMPRVPAGLVRQLLLGQDAEGWSLAYHGRREYVLTLAEDETRCAIVARYASVETRAWFERLVAAPPAGFVAMPLPVSEGEQRYGGDAQTLRWAWDSADRTLEHSLMLSTRDDVQMQAILALTLTMKTNE
ncbi:hypothetical protein CLV44_11740 [Marinobacterium halophilum]|uniref:Uncharacterized protein n=1 Tax=Marinobacterium halophilum TaxID=267374 RepID=A0A2P8ESQ0_9GAMM|nr:hypothetical protein [Marinobacterium halophilum]PSL12511.1 hypothetical protein CLV44_11740 [Marinobacterium halophilum]